ncbi:MAG: outer membrane beta-barrel protein [Salibacteraceae bacterium]
MLGRIGWLLLLSGWMLASPAFSQDKFQITGVFAPSYEWLQFRGQNAQNDIFGSKYSYNFGIEYRGFLSPGLAVVTGLQYNNKGFRNTEIQNDAGLVQSTNSGGIIIGAARYLTVPTNLSIHFRVGKRTSLMVTGGLSTGYMLAQTVNGKDLLPEEEGSDGLFVTSNGKSNIDLFNRVYVGLNLGAGITQQIGSRMILGLHPTFRRQLNRAIPVDANINEVVNTGFNSLTADLKLGWYFNRQFQNDNKTF